MRNLSRRFSARQAEQVAIKKPRVKWTISGMRKWGVIKLCDIFTSLALGMLSNLGADFFKHLI
jgi:hypothetical protein